MSIIPVPIPDRVAGLIGSCMPFHILQAEVDAECAKREVLRFRFPLCADDRADRERELSRMARANKTLGAWNPRLIVKAGGPRG